MGLIYIQKRRIRDNFLPDFPVKVDSRWANNLEFVTAQKGAGLVDLYDYHLSFAKTGSAGNGVGLRGRYAGFDGSTYYTASIGIAPPITMLFVANGAATGNIVLGGSGNLGANTSRVQFDLYNGIPRSIFVNSAGGATAASSTASALTNDEPFVVVYSVGADLVPRVYFRNILTTGTAGSGTVGTYTGTRVGATAKLSSLAPYTKPIYYAACWSGLLTDAESFELLNNPFSILEPLGAKRIWVPVSAGSTASGAASGNEVTTASVIGSSLFNGVLSGSEVTTSSIVGASTHDAASSGNAVVSSSVIGASTFDGEVSGNAVVTSSIVGDSVAAGSAVASGNAVVTSSIIGASIFNGIALGDIVVTGSFVGQGAITAGAASGAIVVSASFVSDAPAQRGAGKKTRKKKTDKELEAIFGKEESPEEFLKRLTEDITHKTIRPELTTKEEVKQYVRQASIINDIRNIQAKESKPKQKQIEQAIQIYLKEKKRRVARKQEMEILLLM